MEEEGDIATAFTLARILSNVPISRGGPTSLVVFDIHALQVSAEMLSLQYCFLTWFLACQPPNHLFPDYVFFFFWFIAGTILLW